MPQIFKVADLFCGAGGLSCGFREAGFETVVAADFNDSAIETHRANFGPHAVIHDLSRLIALPEVDVADIAVGNPDDSTIGLADDGVGHIGAMIAELALQGSNQIAALGCRSVAID